MLCRLRRIPRVAAPVLRSRCAVGSLDSCLQTLAVGAADARCWCPAAHLRQHRPQDEPPPLTCCRCSLLGPPWSSHRSPGHQRHHTARSARARPTRQERLSAAAQGGWVGLLLLLLLLQLLLLLLLSCVCHCRDAALFARKVIALLLRCRILGQSARICSFGCFFCCILQTIIANLQPDVCACTATTDARTCECDALTTIIVRLDFASVPPAARLSITSVSAYAEESCEHTTQSHACREMRACTQRTRALRGRTGQRWGKLKRGKPLARMQTARLCLRIR